MALRNLGKLAPETDAQRIAEAHVSAADVATARAKMARLNIAGIVLLEGGVELRTSAEMTRALLEAEIENE